MKTRTYLYGAACGLLLMATDGAAQSPAPSRAPKGIESEQSLPGRHIYVVQDALRLCKPAKGFWVDLGAGRGQVAIPLIEAADNPVLMIDPNAKALAVGLEEGRKKGLASRLTAVVGRAEELPFPDGSVDFLISRGSIFFWDDPPKGLREVHRVLRPGGWAYIGGGAGSGYPQWAAEQLVQNRRAQLAGNDAEKWKRFVTLRRPEQMKQWANAAKLSNCKILGQGALSADDKEVGQGVWLLWQK